MCLAELRTLAREHLKVTVVVFDDAALSLIGIKQERREYRTDGIDVSGVSWRRVAESMGLASWEAGNENELARAAEGAMAHDGPALIDVRIDPSAYGETMRALRGTE